MSNLIRKRCPKCKNVDIYKRVTLKDRIEKSKRTKEVKYIVQTKLYHCCICGYEFDKPFVGPKNISVSKNISGNSSKNISGNSSRNISGNGNNSKEE